MNTSIITYRNPLDQWFWEGGWVYILAPIAVALACLWGWYAWESYKAKQRRKQRWLEMNETQRAAWRYFTRRNNLEAEEWEK